MRGYEEEEEKKTDLEKQVSDLLVKIQVISCAWCESLHLNLEEVREHIETCKLHPYGRLKAKYNKLLAKSKKKPKRA